MSDRFDGFGVKLIEENDDDWIAHFIEMSNVSAAGGTREEALRELEIAWEAMKESYRKKYLFTRHVAPDVFV